MRKEVIISLILILLVLVLSCTQKDYVCGDNKCDYSLGEDPKICPKDCAPKPVQAKIVCGDGVCDPTLGEDSNTCPADCPLPPPPQGPVCGDGKCELPESSLNCLADCPQPPAQQQQQAQPPQQQFVPQLSKYLIDVDGSKTTTKGIDEDVDLNPEWKYFEKKNNEEKVFIREEQNKEPVIFFDQLMDGKYDPAKDIAILGNLKVGDTGVPIWWTNYAYNSVLGDYYQSIPKEKTTEADAKLVKTATDITLLEQRKSPESCGDGKITNNEMCDPAAPNDPNNKCATSCLWDCSCVPKLFTNFSWEPYVVWPPGGQGPQGGPGAQQGGGQQGAGQQAQQQQTPQQVIIGWNYGETPFQDILDSDKDGVPNNLDKCPKTVPGTKVYPPGYELSGCPVDIYPRDIVFVDNDKDGIWDHQDNCVEDPKGEPVAPLGSKYAGCTEKQVSGG